MQHSDNTTVVIRSVIINNNKPFECCLKCASFYTNQHKNSIKESR